MDRTVRFVACIIAWWLFSAGSNAASFNDIGEWQSDIRYNRGDVVTDGYDIYVNVVPIRGLDPEDSHFAWLKIDYRRQFSLHDRRLFFLGQVVEHDDKYYISRSVNVVRRSNDLNDSRRWMEFTHPGLSYSLPDYAIDDPNMDSLIGIDSNTNGIRDDYEIDIVFSDLPSDVVDSALSAGRSYGQIMSLANSNTELNEIDSTSILTGMVLAKLCKKEMSRVNSGDTWSEATYFNSIDRVEAKYKLQALLMEKIDAENFEIPDGNPCLALANHQ